jgi:hypothetical protein
LLSDGAELQLYEHYGLKHGPSRVLELWQLEHA